MGIEQDLLFGGTETAATVIEWAMAELLKNPDELEKAQQELTTVIGLDRKVHDDDLHSLAYLKCIIKETLRLHAPFPLLLHEATEDLELGGYSVPARSRVLINVWAVGRDKSAWAEPDLFQPSRFAETEVDYGGSHFQLLPFGSGRRSCPGMQLGVYELELVLAQLLHCFDWELPDGMKASELDMEDVVGLTAPRAVRLVAVPKIRLSCPL